MYRRCVVSCSMVCISSLRMVCIIRVYGMYRRCVWYVSSLHIPVPYICTPYMWMPYVCTPCMRTPDMLHIPADTLHLHAKPLTVMPHMHLTHIHANALHLNTTLLACMPHKHFTYTHAKALNPKRQTLIFMPHMHLFRESLASRHLPALPSVPACLYLHPTP